MTGILSVEQLFTLAEDREPNMALKEEEGIIV